MRADTNILAVKLTFVNPNNKNNALYINIGICRWKANITIVPDENTCIK